MVDLLVTHLSWDNGGHGKRVKGREAGVSPEWLQGLEPDSPDSLESLLQQTRARV
jgi:hypothetical protein